jgi:hypothetical protein
MSNGAGLEWGNPDNAYKKGDEHADAPARDAQPPDVRRGAHGDRSAPRPVQARDLR